MYGHTSAHLLMGQNVASWKYVTLSAVVGRSVPTSDQAPAFPNNEGNRAARHFRVADSQ